METLLLSCPHCGFSKEIPRECVPQTAKSLTCPSCQRKSSLAEAVSPADEIVGNNSSQSWSCWGELATSRRVEEEINEQSQEGIAELLRSGWRIYQGKWGSFSLIYLYMVVLTGLPWVVYLQVRAGGIPVEARWQGSLLVLLLTAGASVLGLALGSCALLQVVVNERIGFGRALRDGLKSFPGYLGVSCWVLFMVIGGGVLLIPGLVFAGLFSFAVFVFLHEKERGLDSLYISSQYIRTAFWDNLGKVALLLLLLGLGTVLFVVQIIVLPYVMVCLYLLYGAARQRFSGHRFLAGTGFKRYFVLPVVAVYVAALVSLSVVTVKQARIAGFNVAELRQMASSVMIDSWKMSGVAPPGCGLVLEKSEVRPGEQIKVRLVPSSKISQNYYLVVIGEGADNSESYVLDQGVQQKRFLIVTAPRKKGEYQIRIYSDYDRTMAISSLKFQVI